MEKIAHQGASPLLRFYNYNSDDKINEDETGGAGVYTANGRKEKGIQNIGAETTWKAYN
jgi:hypothetical protein